MSADAKPAVQQAPPILQSPFHRGVNVLGYDPYWMDTSKRRFQWRHFTEIRRAGFDFVRLNLQAFRFMDAQTGSTQPGWRSSTTSCAKPRRPALA